MTADAARNVTADDVSAADPGTLTLVWRGMRTVLDLLVTCLLVFAMERSTGVAPALLGALFAMLYLGGMVADALARRRLRDRAAAAAVSRSGASGPAGPASAPAGPDEPALARGGILLWLVLLVATWAALSFLVKEAAYLAFPLFFVVLHVAGGAIGSGMVVVVTAVAVAAIAHHSGGPTTGGLIGPLLGGAAALAVGLGFRVLLRESRARAAAIAELTAARADVAAMSRRAGELDERARLAGEIHDTVAQGLSSIRLLLGAAERDLEPLGDAADPARERIRLARETAAGNLAETRRIIAELQPAPLSGADLPVALARVCSTTPLGANVSFSVDGDARPLPDEVEAALVRVAQASLGNVVKHAGATRCGVTLTFQPDAVHLDVVDDGVGFDPAAPRGGESFGLAGAERRVSALGGTMSVESAPGAGCGVSMRIPVA
ncbi:sensor histidine kinase [Corynebacterium sp. 335C]